MTNDDFRRRQRQGDFADYIEQLYRYTDPEAQRAYRAAFEQEFSRKSQRPSFDWGGISEELVPPLERAWFEIRMADPRPYITQRQLNLAFEKSVAATVIETTGRVVR